MFWEKVLISEPPHPLQYVHLGLKCKFSPKKAFKDNFGKFRTVSPSRLGILAIFMLKSEVVRSSSMYVRTLVVVLDLEELTQHSLKS